MDACPSNALLQTLLEQLIDEGKLCPPPGRAARRKRLIAMLRNRVDGDSDAWASSDLIMDARRRWKGDYRVRFDDEAQLRSDRDGLWLSGWLLAGRGLTTSDPIEPQRLMAALGAVPVMAREVYLLHQRDDLDFPAIALRLGIGTDAVRRELATALLLLDLALTGE